MFSYNLYIVSLKISIEELFFIIFTKNVHIQMFSGVYPLLESILSIVGYVYLSFLSFPNSTPVYLHLFC